jgi:hypothetical protein
MEKGCLQIVANKGNANDDSKDKTHYKSEKRKITIVVKKKPDDVGKMS